MSERESLSIGQLIMEAAQALAAAGVLEARREAMSLLGHLIARDRTFLITHPETIVSPAEAERLRGLISLRAKGTPIQYLTGHQEFFGLDFEVTPDVLIPRPETELLVETALELLDEEKEPAFVCDVGTGSGCIAIALLHERQTLRAVGLDISTKALRVAARNSVRHHVEERLALVVSDCFAALDAAHAPFTMIVSNPPYIAAEDVSGLPREVREHEPQNALTPGGDGLRIIRRLLTDSPRLLKPGGHLLIEIGFDQHAEIRKLVDPQVWKLLAIHQDLQGIPRTMALRKK